MTDVRLTDRKGVEMGAIFKITYFDAKDNQEHEHDIKYEGPEMSTPDPWMMGTVAALGWCKENNVNLISITNICM